MFTGIIEAVGKVLKYDGSRIWIETPFRRVQKGESISVEGVCLTAAAIQTSRVGFDIGPETARVTTLGTLKKNSFVNLERALRVGDRLGGHWVTGHVEQTGVLKAVKPAGANRWIFVEIPKSLQRFVMAKGSLAIDGISLTVVSRRQRLVQLMIIPHTWAATTLRHKRPRDRVNLEPDLVAKYLYHLRTNA